jgi:hypothetical protein
MIQYPRPGIFLSSFCEDNVDVACGTEKIRHLLDRPYKSIQLVI